MLINTENFIKGSVLVAGLSFLLGGPAAGFLALTSIALIASNANFYSYHTPYYQNYQRPSFSSSWTFPSWSPFSHPFTHVGTTVYLNRRPAAPRPILHQYPHYRNIQSSQRMPDCELVGRRFEPAPHRRFWLRPW